MADDTLSKPCIKCNLIKPLSEYGNRRASPDGLQFRCRSCRSEQHDDYYAKNRDKELARAVKNREDNPEICKARIKDWQSRNKGRVRENNAAWVKANPEKALAKSKRWKDKSKPHLKEYKKKYAEKNPDANKVWVATRRARKLKAGGKHTAKDIRDLYQAQDAKCVYCSISLANGYQVDHIVALSRGGSNDKSNIQLLCQPCNSAKWAKDPEEFKRRHNP